MIHQIWIGPDQIPLELIKTVIKKNPTSEHKLWTECEFLPSELKKHFDFFYSRGSYAFASDIMRYFLVYAYGGIYIDADFECYNSLTPLQNKSWLVRSIAKQHAFLWNGFLSFPKYHPFLQYTLDRIARDPRPPYYGPSWWTKIAHDFVGLKRGISFEEFQIVFEQTGIKILETNCFTRLYGAHKAFGTWLPINKNKTPLVNHNVL